MPRCKRFRRFLREQITPLAVMVLLLCSFKSAIADWNIVPTGSMNPTILEGDRIFVNKLAYGLKVPFTQWHLAHWSEPTRGEMIVFASPVDGTRLVKRVIALPGDTVQLVNNQLLVNGQPASYAPLSPLPQSSGRGIRYATEQIPGGSSHAVMSTPALPAMRNFGAVTVAPDHYFVLGDNRDNSADSRYIGVIPRDNIMGRTGRVVLSLDPENHSLPRLSRTLQAIP